MGCALAFTCPLPRAHSMASTRATYAPVMAAVRVPPSACSTSQSIMIEFSPSADRSIAARSERPTSREISCVRPPTLPRTDSRSLRVLVARGSMEYSPVIQPRPESLRQRGTPAVNDAAHENAGAAERHEARALGVVEPPALERDGTELVGGAAVGTGHAATLTAGSDVEHEALGGEGELALEDRGSLRERLVARRPGHEVREHEATDAGAVGVLGGLGRGHVQVGRQVGVPAEERRLVQREVGAPGQLDEGIALARVAAEDQRPAAGLDAEA